MKKILSKYNTEAHAHTEVCMCVHLTDTMFQGAFV